MNTNAVTAKQTDEPFGIDPVLACRVSVPDRGSASIMHSHSAPAGEAALFWCARGQVTSRHDIDLIDFL
jgi:hypothetical protein